MPGYNALYVSTAFPARYKFDALKNPKQPIGQARNSTMNHCRKMMQASLRVSSFEPKHCETGVTPLSECL
jgi:hypothetical protein